MSKKFAGLYQVAQELEFHCVKYITALNAPGIKLNKYDKEAIKIIFKLFPHLKLTMKKKRKRVGKA